MPAKLINRLRSHTDVSHHRDTAIDNPFDFFCDHHTAFQFNCLSACFLNKAAGVPQSIFYGTW